MSKKKKKYKINKAKFFTSILIFIAALAIIVCGAFLLIDKLNPPKEQSGDDPNTSGSAITGAGIDEPEQELTPEQLAEQWLNEEVADAKTKITSASYPVNTVEDFDLVLVNKTHTVSKEYRPKDLTTVDRFVNGVGNDDTHKLRKVAADALNRMFDAAAADGIEIRLRTGYRSYDYQQRLYNDYVARDGVEKADTYSARPGTSEHQTGLACDLGGKTEGFELSRKFGDTKEGKWVAEHAHEYGFIIRYTDGTTDENGVRQPGAITGYIYEPWHIRYVGIDHATRIYNQGITLEEYLGVTD